MSVKKYSSFVARAKRGVAYWTRIAMRDFTEELLGKLSAMDITNAALAQAAGVSPSYITKVLRGSENFTLETMSKLALVVGCKVRIHIAATDSETYWIDRPATTTVTVVTDPAQKSTDAKITGFVGSTVAIREAA